MDELTRVALAARDNDAARARFVELAYPGVWRLCAGLVDQESADDLAQVAFVRALHSLARFRGDAPARAWLLSIARRTCVDEIRARQRQRRLTAWLAAGRGRPQAGVMPDASQLSTVADLLERLDPDRRAAFVLTQLIGCSYEESATICDCPVGTVRSRVARARSDLIAALEAGQPVQRASLG